jgi:hypothetical protein
LMLAYLIPGTNLVFQIWSSESGRDYRQIPGLIRRASAFYLSTSAANRAGKEGWL